MVNTHQKISGLIITYNEEKNIRAVLECFDFCDEIIVVDSFSTDKTIEIAHQNPKVKIYQQTFVDYTKQRNKALSLAENDWVFFLDGDERTTPELEKEIIETINSRQASDAYYIYRVFFVGSKKIRFSGTQNDKNFRLFRKSKCWYTPTKKVHETLDINGTTGVLRHKLLHYSFESYDKFKNKMLYYGVLKGTELSEKGKKYSLITHWSKVAFKFIKTYFLKFGFLDGTDGFKISYLQSLYVDATYKALKAK